MTANQIAKKLAAAGIVGTDRIVLEIGRDEVEVRAIDADGDTMLTKTAQVRGKITKSLGWDQWNGYKTGYGAWVVRPGAAVKDYEGVAARMHY